MSRTLLIAGAVCAMSAAALLTPVQASPATGLTTSKRLPAQSMIEKAGYGRCWRWNAICRDRWGWGWRYRRCMRNHAC
ncbi:MAG: hypothetical protein WC684_08090 [Hyphomicrobium sp.]